MYDTILIPTDGSDEAQLAVDHAVDLAAALDATVHALYVMDLPGVPRALSIRDDEEQMRREYEAYGEKVTNEVADLAAEAGVDAVTAITAGTVSDEIVDYADEEDLDAIVMGAAYRGKVGGLLGSTTEKVVRSANVPVVSLRMGELN